MGMSLSWAEFLSYWSNWALIGALVVGVLATYAIVVSGNVKEAALKRELAEAGAVAETAKATAATANERAADLEKQAAELNTALDKERQKRAPRHLKSEQLDTLVAELANIGERLSIVGRDEDEPRQYADQFIAAMRAANLLDENMPYVLTNSPSNNWTGIRLYIPSAMRQDDLENDLLTKAFKKAQIPVGGLSGGSVNGIIVDPKLNFPRRTIYVGQKPLEN